MAIVNRAAKKAEKKAVDQKENAVGFFNWTALNKHGEEAIRGGRGFAIFDNQYTSKQEKQLVNLAEKNGGEITVNMKVTIRLNEQKEVPELDLDSFV